MPHQNAAPAIGASTIGAPAIGARAVGAPASRRHRGWHARGYLPHFDAAAFVQTITFRLADSLPKDAYEKIAASGASPAAQHLAVEKIMDRGLGSKILAEPAVAAIVSAALEHFDGDRYQLLAWVIMPNHVHVMIEQLNGTPLASIVHAWKSFSAHAINRQRGTDGRVWAREYFDRFVRNERHYANAKFYIENNPVKAGLVARAEDWPYSSATARTR